MSNQSQGAAVAHPRHAHPNYLAIWIALLALLGISLALGQLHNVAVGNSLIFGIAAIKIALVMRYFMHLKFEPWLLAVLLIGAFLYVVAFFVGVVPDIYWRNGWS